MTIKPNMRSGDYGRHARGSNDQGASQAPWEDRVLTRGGQPKLGNVLARNVGGGGPGVGYSVSKSGQQAQHGPAVGSRPGPNAMSERMLNRED
jgi:hypothetical protein